MSAINNAREWLSELASLLGDIEPTDVEALETLSDGLIALEQLEGA